jgi:uncharacterized membrane protein
MISWIIIGILVLVAFVLLKTNHFRHRMWIFLFVILALFLYLSITFINAKHDLDINSTEGVFKSIKIYLGWLANSFQNLKSITGNVIKMDWTSTDETFFNKTSVMPEKK